MLESLQREVASQCDIEHIQLQELHRFNKQMLLTIAVVVGATYFLFPQFADLPEIVDQVKQASWGWLPLILLMSVFTYVGAAMSLSGAVPEPARVRTDVRDSRSDRRSRASSLPRGSGAWRSTCGSCRSKASTSPSR